MALAHRLGSARAVDRELGVGHDSTTRWAGGSSRPRGDALAALEELAQRLGVEPDPALTWPPRPPGDTAALVRALAHRLGSAPAAAKAVGASVCALSRWARGASAPRRRFLPAIRAAAEEHGVVAEDGEGLPWPPSGQGRLTARQRVRAVLPDEVEHAIYLWLRRRFDAWAAVAADGVARLAAEQRVAPDDELAAAPERWRRNRLRRANLLAPAAAALLGGPEVAWRTLGGLGDALELTLAGERTPDERTLVRLSLVVDELGEREFLARAPWPAALTLIGPARTRKRRWRPRREVGLPSGDHPRRGMPVTGCKPRCLYCEWCADVQRGRGRLQLLRKQHAIQGVVRYGRGRRLRYV